MSDVRMPKLSDTMEEGTVLEWKKAEGDDIKRGDVLAEIESDKASFELEAEADGALHVIVEQGRAVPVGDVIATLGEAAAADTPAAPAAEAPAEPAAAAAPADPAAKAAADDVPPAPTAPAGPAPTKAAEPAAEQPEDGAAAPLAPQPAPAAAPASGARSKASPLAKRLAEQIGVDLALVTGSGPEGRIVKEDVLAAGEAGSGTRPAVAPKPAAPRSEGPEVERLEPNRVQAVIARRMAESKATVPHFYVTVEARMDEAMRVRDQLRATVPGADKLTVTDLLVRACALALREHPEVNASWAGGHFERKRAINIGIAVAQEAGLVVPVLRDVDRKDLVGISIETRQLVERARAGKATPQDLSGGTFSISNLGMFGVDEFAAIVNPPEAAIVAVGAVKDAAVVDEGQVRVGKVMRMTISVDHRVLYGADAARFLAAVKQLLENPVALVIPPA